MNSVPIPHTMVYTTVSASLYRSGDIKVVVRPALSKAAVVKVANMNKPLEESIVSRRYSYKSDESVIMVYFQTLSYQYRIAAFMIQRRPPRTQKTTQRNLLRPSNKQNRLDFVDLHFQCCLKYIRQPENAENRPKTARRLCCAKDATGKLRWGLVRRLSPPHRGYAPIKRYVRLPPVHGRKRATRMHGIVFRQVGCCLQPLIRLHRSGFASGGCCVHQVVKERVLLKLGAILSKLKKNGKKYFSYLKYFK